MKVLGICGSLRAQSTNKSLLIAAKNLLSSRAEFELYEGLHEFPQFNPDLEHGTVIPAVITFRKKVLEADLILISTPEYAHGIPGSLKNALDWIVGSGELSGKKVGLIGAAAQGASFALPSLLEIIKTMDAKIIQASVLSIAGVRAKVDAAGTIADPTVTEELQNYLEGLLNKDT